MPDGKKYKVSDKYKKILSTTSYTTIKNLEKDTGSLKLINKEKNYPYIETYKAKNGDIYSVEPPSEISYRNYYFVTEITTKAQNVVNIKKATNYKKFLKKLGIRKYSKIFKNKLLNFSFVLETVNLVFDDPDDSDLQYVRWYFNANSKNKITPNTEINFWLTSNWDY